MEEYVKKQLEEQIGKLINHLADGKLDLLEQRFKAVENYILRDEKQFINGIRDDEKKREHDVKESKIKFIKYLEESLNEEDLDNKVMKAFGSFDWLHNQEKIIMSKYANELVESVVSYTRSINNNSNPVDNKIESKNVEDKIDNVINNNNVMRSM